MMLGILFVIFCIRIILGIVLWGYPSKGKWPPKAPNSIYLCGTMSHLKDYGSKWRDDISVFLTSLGDKVYNPCIEEGGTPEWEKLPQAEQERIIIKDLDEIYNNTKAIVCYFTKYSTGTVSELTFAYYFNIPIYLISKEKPEKWPGTIINSAGNKWFSSFDDFKKYWKKHKAFRVWKKGT